MPAKRVITAAVLASTETRPAMIAAAKTATETEIEAATKVMASAARIKARVDSAWPGTCPRRRGELERQGEDEKPGEGGR